MSVHSGVWKNHNSQPQIWRAFIYYSVCVGLSVCGRILRGIWSRHVQRRTTACDGTSGAPWGCCRMDIKGARLSWSPSAAKSWGRSHLREPRHSRLSRGHESHCRGDTLYSSIVLIALLFVFWVHRYPISGAINTRTAQCERLRDINTANCS